MATSGNYQFSTNRNSIILEAMKKCLLLHEGQTPNSTQYTDGAALLNKMVAAWVADGMPAWSRKIAYILPWDAAGAEARISSNSTYVYTAYATGTTSAAASSGQATFTTTASVPNGSAKVLVQHATGPTWYTVSSSVGGTVTLSTNLSEALTSGQRFIYVSNSNLLGTSDAFPILKLYDATAVNVAGGTRRPLVVTAESTIRQNVNLTSEGTPVYLNHWRNRTDSTFTIWPAFSSIDEVIEIRYQAPFQSFDSSTDEPDFPQEWYEALEYGLAVRLATVYGMPLQERMVLKQEADIIIGKAFAFGIEDAHLFFQPDSEGK